MKTYQKILALLLVAALLVYGGCTLGEYRVTKRLSTVVEHDSTTAFSILPIPIAIVKDSIHFKVKTEHDTLQGKPYPVPGETVYLPIGTPLWAADEINDYNATRKYDTALNGKRDTATIQFSVKHNRVLDWKLKLISHDSTKVVKPPKKFVLSFHPTAIGNVYKPVFAYGGGLNFKFPDESAFSVNALYVPGQPKGKRTMFQLTKDFPIRINLFKLKK